MEKHVFDTPLGEIWLWGEAGAFRDKRPVLLVILGALAAPDGQFFRLQPDLPEAAVVVAQLPGHLSPALAATSVGAFAGAFDHVLRTAFAGRVLTVCGESAGGLVALAMRAPGPFRLALDPPLRTAKLWPALPVFRQFYDTTPAYRPFLTNVLGVTATGVEDRDYAVLLDRPARVLIGGVPLMPERPLDRQPGFVDAPERRELEDRPWIRLTTLDGVGHLVAEEAPLVVLRVLKELVAGAAAVAG